jgi:hypothetical protein
MSSPYSNIETKAEIAVKNHVTGIATRIPGVTVYSGIDSLNLESSEIKLPCVVANATGSEETIFQSGQYAVEMTVEVISSADDTTAAKHRERVAYIRDEFANDWAALSLSSQVSDFMAAAVVLQKTEQDVDERRWVTSIGMLIHCRPSD